MYTSTKDTRILWIHGSAALHSIYSFIHTVSVSSSQSLCIIMERNYLVHLYLNSAKRRVFLKNFMTFNRINLISPNQTTRQTKIAHQNILFKNIYRYLSVWCLWWIEYLNFYVRYTGIYLLFCA